MLSLDDPRWRELRHAYGVATDLPELLKALALDTAPKTNSEAEPWFSLWSRLCHQGDIYTATYAAVPHIVGIALQADGPIDFSFFQFPAEVEVARQTDSGPAVPEAHAEDYHKAISLLTEAVSLHRSDSWDRSTLLSAAAALAVAKGHADIAGALLNLDDDWIARINGDERD